MPLCVTLCERPEFIPSLNNSDIFSSRSPACSQSLSTLNLRLVGFGYSIFRKTRTAVIEALSSSMDRELPFVFARV